LLRTPARARIVAALAVGSLLALLPGAGGSARAQPAEECTPPGDRMAVTTELWIDPAEPDAVPVRTRTTVEVPADWREVRALHTNLPSDQAYQTALECLLPPTLPFFLDKAPSLRLERGVATVTADTSDRVYGLYDYGQETQPPVCEGQNLGPWLLRGRGGGFRLCLSGDAMPAAMTIWAARVHLRATEVLAAGPVPERNDGQGSLDGGVPLVVEKRANAGSDMGVRRRQ